jgi:hypothetical protein
MSLHQSKSIFDQSLSDDVDFNRTVSLAEATALFEFFKTCKLFRWHDANNDCEDRANAICILLNSWNIPNYKGWVFSGYFLKKENSNLNNNWNYHVAALLPVKEDNNINYYIVDPATSEKLITMERWATLVTETSFSYHIIKNADHYIFSPRKIARDNWYKRNKRNHRWTMQGLSGINGVSSIGKAQLCFNKRKVKLTERLFNNLKKHKWDYENNK